MKIPQSHPAPGPPGKPWRHSRRILLICSAAALVVAFVFVLAFTTALAPMPPRTVVNPETRQCAMLVPGDECGDVVLPPGWEYLPAGEACPQGYAVIELRPEWVHFKAPFCCTEGHSGSPGDCEDLLIQPEKRQCAFVEDIQACRGPGARLPLGWAIPSEGQNLCPGNFTWVEGIACEAGDNSAQSGATPTVALSAVPAASSSTALPPTATPAASDRSSPLLPCLPGGALALAVWVAWLRMR